MSQLSLLGFGAQGWGHLLLIGALVTLAVTLASLAIGAVLGTLIAWGKLSHSLAANVLADAYTTVFRGVPELLVIYLIYFGGSTAVTRIGAAFGFQGFLGLPSFLAGALAVGVISGAYQAEVFRGRLPRRGPRRAGGGARGRHVGLAAATAGHRAAGAALRPARARQCLAAQPEGFRAGLGHGPRRADAHEPGRGRIDA